MIQRKDDTVSVPDYLLCHGMHEDAASLQGKVLLAMYY